MSNGINIDISYHNDNIWDSLKSDIMHFEYVYQRISYQLGRVCKSVWHHLMCCCWWRASGRCRHHGATTRSPSAQQRARTAPAPVVHPAGPYQSIRERKMVADGVSGARSITEKLDWVCFRNWLKHSVTPPGAATTARSEEAVTKR